jgi:hypothetical protein
VKYSVIEDCGKITVFERRREAIRFAKKVSGRVYDWGEMIWGQLLLKLKNTK